MNDKPDIPTLLQQALEDEARRVEPRGDALAAILARTRASTPWYRRSWVGGVAAAGLATAATVVGVAVLTQPGGPADGGPAGEGTSPTVESRPPAPQVSVPVYYLGDSTRGPRLYREFHQVRTTDGAPEAAVAEMLRGRPDDPDYWRTPWRTDVRSVDRVDGVITVDLTAAPKLYPMMDPSRQLARVTVQQLVYTVQAAEHSADPVRLTVDGRPLDSVLGVDTSQPIERADPLSVQAMVSITAPSQGAEVSSPVPVVGIANVFEANVSWQVLQDGVVVKEGFTTAKSGMQFSTFETQIALPAGSYSLRFFSSSPEDGRAMYVDTKDITVR
jgi:hypothetical protein